MARTEPCWSHARLRGTAQLALVLRGFLGEDVALERLERLILPLATQLEPLGGAALGFHLWHYYLLSFYSSRQVISHGITFTT